MNDLDRIEVGLDIGTTKICVIAGKRNEYGKLEILGMGKAISEGVVGGMVHNIDKTVDAIKKALAEAEENAGIEIGEVNVGIAGQHIRSKNYPGGIIRHQPDTEISAEDVQRLNDDMHRIVIPPGNNIIHVMPQEYSIDHQGGIKDPIGHLGAKLEADFHIITANTNAVSNIAKSVSRAGLEMGKRDFKIKNLYLEPLASSMSVLTDEEMEAGVVLVDIGGGTTDVAIFHENIIRHTAVIPLGGNVITQDVKQGCMVMMQQAEQLKTKFGCAIPDETNPNEVIAIPGLRNRQPKEISVKNLSNIINARMEEIIEWVWAEINMSGYQNRLAGGIVVTGGGSMLKHVKLLFEYMTGMDTRIGYPNEHLGKSKVEIIKSPVFATSIGLVLAGFHEAEQKAERQKDRRTVYNASPSNSNKPDIQSAITTGKITIEGITKSLKKILMSDFDDKKDY